MQSCRGMCGGLPWPKARPPIAVSQQLASRMPNARAVVQGDLDSICERLAEEFGRLAGKRLLITGGAGFLGYYLVQAALHWNRGAGSTGPIKVTVFDNLARGAPPWLGQRDAEGAIELIRHDITKPLPRGMADYAFIIHAAGIASPTFYRAHPIETMDANVNGLRRLLDHARDQADRGRPVEGFLFMSSSEIYGDPPPEHIPTPETYRGNVSCTGPRACYDESKRFGETLCVNFCHHFGIPVSIARPFNNYGPGLKITDRRVLPDFARNIVERTDVVLLSDGSSTRTFCYVEDAVVGYYKVLTKGSAGEPYNIGTEEPEISMSELADKLARLGTELLGYKGRVVRRISPEEDYLVDNPSRRCPDIQKARAELGYEPQVTLDDGLRRSLLWYSENQRAPEA